MQLGDQSNGREVLVNLVSHYIRISTKKRKEKFLQKPQPSPPKNDRAHAGSEARENLKWSGLYLLAHAPVPVRPVSLNMSQRDRTHRAKFKKRETCFNLLKIVLKVSRCSDHILENMTIKINLTIFHTN